MTKAVDKPESVGMSARRLERIRPAMQAYVDRGVYAGITTLIARRGKVVHEEQFGWRDKEAQSPMTRRCDLPPLLDDEADRLHRPDDAARGRPVHALRSAGEIRSGFRRREGARAGRKPRQSGAPDQAPRFDDPHQRPDLPLRRGLSADQRCTRGPGFSTPSVRWKRRSTIWPGFRSPSSRERAGATASASTSSPA